MNRDLRSSQTSRSWVAWTLCVGLSSLLQPIASGADVDFYRDVYPVLKANCISCHNKTTTKSGLNMETPELMKKGGESGAGVIPGKSADSLILQAAAHTGDFIMPPKNNATGAVNLTPDETALLSTWIDQGAKNSVKQARQVAWQPLPPGLNPIYTVSMTKDGRFAACGRANQIFIYDLSTRRFAMWLTDDSLKLKALQNGGLSHRALVQSLAFSPDGTRLASGSFREVKIWRREKVIAASRKSDAALGAVVSVLSADGKQILCADQQGTLHFLSVDGGTVIKTIPQANAAGIKLLSISPDSSKVAVYGVDAALCVWSLPDGKPIATGTNVPGVRALVWTRDGKAIAAAAEDKIVRVWPSPVGESSELVAPKELKGATGAIAALEAGSNRDHLLVASEDGKVRLWSISEAKVLRELGIAGVNALALSQNDKQLAAGCTDGAVRVWDLDSAKQIAELRGDTTSNQQMASLDWVVAAQQLDLAFQTKELARIEAENKALDELLKKSNETIATVKKVLPEKQNAVKSATDAKLAAQEVAGTFSERIAQAANGKPDAALEKQNKEAQDKLAAATTAEIAAIAAVAASENHLNDAEAEVNRITEAKIKNGSTITAATAAIATSKQVQTKASTDLAAAKQALMKENSRPLAVVFSPDAQSIATVFNDGALRVWAVVSAVPIEHVSVCAATTAASIVASADGAFAACSTDGATANVSTASRWVVERVLGGEKSDSPLAFVDRVNAVRFSPDGTMLAAGGGEPSRSGDISLWDVASGKLIKAWNERHSDAVLSLDFSPDGSLIASGGADKVARVTEIANGKQTRFFEGHTHHVMGVTFRADGRVLASAGADGVVLVWDMRSGERKKKIEGWEKEVTSLQFIGATTQILTSAGDNLIRIVGDDGAEIRAIPNLPDFMQSAACAATASLIIGGGEDGLLRVWDGTNGRELAEFGAE